MRDPGRTRESCRAQHRMARRGGRRAVGRIALQPPEYPGGWGWAYDGAQPERRSSDPADDWGGIERRREDRRRSEQPHGGGERRTGPDRRSLIGHARDFATRFREPLIGLGMAAAAMPAFRTKERTEEPGPRAPEHASATPEANAAAAAARQPERDIDAEVGARWSNTERERTIDAAVGTYGIDAELAANIYDHARNEGVDPKLAYGLVKTESGFRHTAVSHVGARGLTQLMPRTARWLQPGTRPTDLFKPEVSLKVGFRYLRQLMDRYDGDQRLALTAYNRGPGIVDRAVSRGRDPDNGYARTVVSNSLRSASGPSTADNASGDRQPS